MSALLKLSRLDINRAVRMDSHHSLVKRPWSERMQNDTNITEQISPKGNILRAPHVPQKGQSETMTDKELKLHKKPFKNQCLKWSCRDLPAFFSMVPRRGLEPPRPCGH